MQASISAQSSNSHNPINDRRCRGFQHRSHRKMVIESYWLHKRLLQCCNYRTVYETCSIVLLKRIIPLDSLRMRKASRSIEQRLPKSDMQSTRREVCMRHAMTGPRSPNSDIPESISVDTSPVPIHCHAKHTKTRSKMSLTAIADAFCGNEEG